MLLANRQEEDAELPKVATVVNTVYAKGRPGVPAKDHGLGRSVFSFFKRALAARLSGKWKDTPLFEGPPWHPVATPTIRRRSGTESARHFS